ncbi:hypothetical protein NOK12_16380 [Nocardioides sp. OK12]|uniref:hypothetical protein n=1 Tax=Nocardioides sp. OK12 TaxID=2758661 RepID=UPI0021C45B03|nr:hypothetical protein [Nocardioides sp. OK12]GHJ59120.1 hypothetical protein NOK12_16380 [Nocardioides sp. OK12]
MSDYTVTRTGTDSSGRGIYMTTYMRDWWARVVDTLGFEPTIVQGAFMGRNGGGASASAGYHDGAGCLDLRVWNLASSQVAQTIRVLRELGAAAWLRDQRHGMDPHIHLVLGSDAPLASGAAYQWRQYLAGRDGLASNGADYHPRPSPLVTTPPKEVDPMADYATQLDEIAQNTRALLVGQAKAQRQNAAIRAKVAKLIKKGNATREDLADLQAALDNEEN